MIIIIVLGLVLALGLYVWSAYNKLVGMRNDVKAAQANIDTMLQRRFDLIPNLVNTVKGYATHEKETLEEITRQRAAVGNASSLNEKVQADQALSHSVMNLFAVSENYPDLKANQNFLALQEELTTTENKISGARLAYNGSVNDYNTATETFPNNVFFKNFKKAELLQVAEEVRTAPKVEF